MNRLSISRALRPSNSLATVDTGRRPFSFKETSMRLHLICGLLAATLASAAQAGFVDERATPAVPAASAPESTKQAVALAPAAVRGRVVGQLPIVGWARNAPEAASMRGISPGVAAPFVAFGDAIFRLLPEGHPAVVLDGPHDAIGASVTWSTGLSRAEALDQIASNFGLVITFTGDKPGSVLSVEKAGAAPSSIAADAMPTAAAAAAPVATAVPTSAVAKPVPVVVKTATGRAFEVRLSDIRLADSMKRWAEESGVRIRWDAGKHVLIDAPQTFVATDILDAVAQALSTSGIRNSDYPLEACQYSNTPPLIRITRLGEQAKDCPQ